MEIFHRSIIVFSSSKVNQPTVNDEKTIEKFHRSLIVAYLHETSNKLTLTMCKGWKSFIAYSSNQPSMKSLITRKLNVKHMYLKHLMEKRWKSFTV